ncbi:unnamed protein product [Meganyctiphanes norvegica]|uniref:Uncharacterized protein n=1 Tax=Meganyctiphanes norvegica TaxID=48144 RepID=A0AAV2SUX0_MEGNR
MSENQKQGIDEEVKKMMEEKREIRKDTKRATNMEEKKRLIEVRKNIENLIKTKIEENEEMKIDKITKNLSEKRNNYNIMWKMKKKSQKKQSSAFALKDKEGNELRSPDNIKKRTSEHYVDLYEPNPVKEGYERYEEELERLITYCWNAPDETKEELMDEEITEVINNLEKDKATGPDGISNEMIQRGGESMRNSIIRMMGKNILNRRNPRRMADSLH